MDDASRDGRWDGDEFNEASVPSRADREHSLLTVILVLADVYRVAPRMVNVGVRYSMFAGTLPDLHCNGILYTPRVKPDFTARGGPPSRPVGSFGVATSIDRAQHVAHHRGTEAPPREGAGEAAAPHVRFELRHRAELLVRQRQRGVVLV